MKIFKLIGAVTVIGIALWASTVHAQNVRSRTVDLECIPGNGVAFCGAAGTSGQLSIHRFELGSNNNKSGFIPTDGLPHPYVELTTTMLGCQSPRNDGERQFYVLYITLSSVGSPIRIINFNPSCDPLFHHTATRLPDIGDPNLWFTDDLLVRVVLEADEVEDFSLADVLAGTNQQPAAGCISPPSGLVSWWPGDVNALDIVGPNDGTLFNGATFAPGLVGPAFSFNGVNDFMFAPETAITSDLQELTVDAWVKHDSLPVQIQRYISGSNETFVLRHNGSGQLHFFIRIGSVLHHVQVNGVLQVGVFHHVAGTFDGSIMRLYLDGVEVGSLAVSGTVEPPTSVFLSSSSNEALDGLLDEVEFFDRALTAPEIAAIFAAGTAGKCK